MRTDLNTKDRDPPYRLYVAKPLCGDEVYREAVECTRALVDEGHLNRAAAICQLNGLRPGGRVEWLYYLAQIRFKQCLYEQAHAVLMEALNRQPGYQKARSQLGLVCIQLKDFEEAIWHLTLAIALDPRDPIPWGRLGICYDDQTGYKEVARMAWARSRHLRGVDKD
jgi:tetratricopeptide (TPR) repeat protein